MNLLEPTQIYSLLHGWC